MKKAILIFLIIAIAAVGYTLTTKPQFEVRITADQIQRQLEKNSPYEKSHLFLVKVVLSDPKVSLKNGSDWIGVSYGVSILVTGVEALKRRVYAETGIRYDPELKGIFLDNPGIEMFEIPSVPNEVERIVREIVVQALPHILESQPVYLFDGAETKTKIAGALLRDIKVADGVLTVVFGL